jgi:hypothetical protein
MSHGTAASYQRGCRCDACKGGQNASFRRWKAAVADQPIPDSLHGRYSTYSNRGCRCEACTAAHRANCAAGRARRHASTPPADAHGKAATYTNWGCRCDECRAAWNAYWRDHGRRRPLPLPTNAENTDGPGSTPGRQPTP